MNLHSPPFPAEQRRREPEAAPSRWDAGRARGERDGTEPGLRALTAVALGGGTSAPLRGAIPRLHVFSSPLPRTGGAAAPPAQVGEAARGRASPAGLSPAPRGSPQAAPGLSPASRCSSETSPGRTLRCALRARPLNRSWAERSGDSSSIATTGHRGAIRGRRKRAVAYAHTNPKLG